MSKDSRRGEASRIISSSSSINASWRSLADKCADASRVILTHYLSGLFVGGGCLEVLSSAIMLAVHINIAMRACINIAAVHKYRHMHIADH